MTVPVWLLDVDGVVNAATKKPDPNVWPADDWVQGRASDDKRSWPITYARPVAAFIREVHEQGRAEIRWHTTWQEWAHAVSRLLGLPEFPIQEAPEWAEFLVGDRVKLHDDEWWKIGAALRVVEEEKRPLLWTDDDADSVWNLPYDVRTRIVTAQPTLIVAPAPETGLCRRHLRQIDEFLTEHAPAKTTVEND